MYEGMYVQNSAPLCRDCTMMSFTACIAQLMSFTACINTWPVLEVGRFNGVTRLFGMECVTKMLISPLNFDVASQVLHNVCV